MSLSFVKVLSQGVEKIGLDLDQRQLDQLVELQAQLLKWNQAFNLTAIKDESSILKLHLLDSLAIAPFWCFDNTLDVGTGAGFPGLPLAIALPDKNFYLLDSNSKKVRFIKQQLHHLGLSNVTVFHQRIENHQGCYDAIVSRAFASLTDMLQSTKDLVGESGRWMAMKGSYPKQELEQMPNWAIEVKSHKIQVPGLNAERCLVELTRRND